MDTAVKETAIAVVLVRGESVLTVAERYHIPRSTLRGWLAPLRAARDVMTALTPSKQRAIRSDLAERWLRIEHGQLNLLDHLPAPETWKDHRDLIVSAGISADKHFDYTEGRRGANLNVNVGADARQQSMALDELTVDELRQLLALAERAAAGEDLSQALLGSAACLLGPAGDGANL